MHLLIVPGNDATNREWARNCERSVGRGFTERTSFEYQHWDVKNSKLDYDGECGRLRRLIAQRGQPTVILAKSAGVAVTALAASDGSPRPQAAVFCGTTLNLDTVEGRRYGALLRSLGFECVFVQQRDDPLCSLNRLTEQLNSLRPDGWRIVESPGNDHRYSHIPTLESAIQSALELAANKPQHRTHGSSAVRR